MTADLAARVSALLPGVVEDLTALVEIPSVSSLPDRHADVEQPVEVAAGGAPGCQLQGEREPVEPSRDLGEGLQVPVHPRLEVGRPLGAAVSEP